MALLEARDLISCGWIMHTVRTTRPCGQWVDTVIVLLTRVPVYRRCRLLVTSQSNPYIFLELTPGSAHSATADSWRIDTHRSRVGEGGVNPHWGEPEDEFTFRFAVPTHHVHVTSRERAIGPAENAWQATVSDENTRAAHGLESLFQALYTGPPVLLHCAVFHKSQLMPHHFMGRGKVRPGEWCVCG